ncbi:hypothetical protein ACWEJ6_21235 [Nonomuraea sp. NPDC004702]
MTRLFARHSGRHRRHGSLTGWASLAQFRPAVVFPRRRAPLAMVPLADEDLVPFAPEPFRRNPYEETSR